MGVEVELFAFLGGKEVQNFNKDLSHFWIKFYMILGLLTETKGKELQCLINLVVAVLFCELLAHGLKDIKELKKAIEAANKFNLQEAFFV